MVIICAVCLFKKRSHPTEPDVAGPRTVSTVDAGTNIGLSLLGSLPRVRYSSLMSAEDWCQNQSSLSRYDDRKGPGGFQSLQPGCAGETRLVERSYVQQNHPGRKPLTENR